MSEQAVPVRKGADGFMVRFNKPKFRQPPEGAGKVPKKLARRLSGFDNMKPVAGIERDGKTVYITNPSMKNQAFHRPGSNK